MKTTEKQTPDIKENSGVRADLIDTLCRRYSPPVWQSSRMRRRATVKALAWKATVKGASAAKRLLDITLGSALLVAFSPLFLVVAAAIKLTDGGPVLFRQRRVGRYGEEFLCPKFRSMVTNAEKLKDSLLAQNDHADGITFKMKRDPRITWIGRIIRKLSIDELPQLVSVVRGEMSLVGPRPPVPREVAQYSLTDRRRLEVKPGLTCLWQVSGRGDIAFPEQVKLDVEYIEAQSLLMDVKLLLKTVPAVLFGRGAY